MILFIFIILLFFPNVSFSTEQSISEKVSAGVWYKHSYIEKPTAASVHIIEIDPKKVSIQSKVALDRCISLITTSIMAKEIKALVAINAGYSDDLGIPAGILKVNDTWFSDQKCARAALGFDTKTNTFLIDIINTKTTVTFENTIFSVDRVNQQRKGIENILYLPTFGKKTLKHENTINFVINNKKIIGIIPGTEQIEIPKSGFIFSVYYTEENSKNYSLIKMGDQTSFSIEIIPEENSTKELWNVLPNIIGGVPLLVKNEKIISNFEKEKTLESFLKTRFARTAVGIKKDGTVIFTVVDDKGLLQNRGMSIPELAKLMFEIGCSDALNLSGGKSSTCLIKNNVINCSLGDFSFGGTINIEKPISDILGIVVKNG